MPEWPENIEELLPEETLRVYIDVDEDGARRLRFIFMLVDLDVC